MKIGEWLADDRLDEIQRGEERVKLDRRTMAVLMYLASKPGEVISTEELLDNVWRGVVVAPSSVYQTITVLRRALGDEAEKPRFVATVQRRGYRLIAPVAQVEAEGAAQPDIPPDTKPATGQKPWRWRWQTTLIAIVVLLGIAYLLGYDAIRRGLVQSGEGAGPSSASQSRSIAVLPFASSPAGDGNSYLADGLTEGLVQTLSRLPGTRVTARTTTFALRGSGDDARKIAETLGVRYVIDGSVRRDGDQLNIGVQLVDGTMGFALWSATYDCQLGDLMRVQQEIARSVAQALDLVLSRDAVSRLAHGTTLDPVAVDAYLRARAYWSERSAVSLRSAREHYERAIQSDPRLAAAHMGLAELLVLLPFYGIEPTKTAFPKARESALRALEIDPGLAEAHATLAVVHYQYEWDWTKAEAEFRRAIELNPNHATTRQWYAEFLGYAGRTADSAAQIAVAGDLDPLSPIITMLRGSPALWARQYPEAEEKYRAAIARHPDFPLAHYGLGLTLLGLGRAEEASAEFGIARESLGDEFVLPSLAHAYVGAGRRADAERVLEGYSALGRERYVSPYKIAVLQAALGRTDEALGWLERARDERDDRLVLIGVDGLLDSLRTHARFQEIQKQVMGTARGA
jgi:TolB-like protein/DNA-binding winged helix-turn-helix (wHTH) protein/Tfp pilus assembly protein PilF